MNWCKLLGHKWKYKAKGNMETQIEYITRYCERCERCERIEKATRWLFSYFPADFSAEKKP